MNKKIDTLNIKLAEIQGNAYEIEQLLQAEWNEVFAKDMDLQDAIGRVQSSTEYSWDRHGEIVSYLRYDLNQFEEHKLYLTEYLRDQCVGLDFYTDCLTYSQGPCIVINDDGDVYDQDGDKFFIKRDDYRNEDGDLDYSKRNELIEQYMEKTGYYPGVFSSDRYGNVFHVNTQEGK